MPTQAVAGLAGVVGLIGLGGLGFRNVQRAMARAKQVAPKVIADVSASQ
jgi:hypothetical protein